MKISILLCDNVDQAVRNKFKDYDEQFEVFLNLQGNLKVHCETHDVRSGEMPTGQYDGYLVTGSRHGVYEDHAWIPKLMSFIRKLSSEGKKVFGVCFGHQVIVEALGGKVEKQQTGFRLGVQEFSFLEKPKFFQTDMEKFSLCVSCQDQVVALPPGAKNFCTQPYVKFGGIVHGSNVLTFQGHPEMSKAYNRYIMDSKLEKGLIDANIHREFISTLENPVDDKHISAWVVQFFKS